MSPEVLTVSALNNRASEVLLKNFPLLWVAGEVSNLTRAASGHVYFSLKDKTAQVRCVMFRNRSQLIAWRLENGQQVEVQALVTLYAARGDFQLNIEGMRRAGIGAFYEAYVRLREQLEREGLFATEKNLPLPRFPRRVCIISSPQAAALRDIFSTLQRRAPHLQAILYPVPVQGEDAAGKIAAAIALAGARAAQDKFDVLILARGGGGIEDLWAFNEEAVARAIAACPLPVVSGIGHETDTCIADLVADQRAATPTAAAELVSAGWFAATQQLAVLGNSMQRSLRGLLETRMQRIDLLAHRLVHPGRKLAHNRQVAAHLSTRLNAALGRRLRRDAVELERWRLRLSQARPTTQPVVSRLALAEQRLSSAVKCGLAAQQARLGTLAVALAQLSPQATLDRGYSIVRDSHGAVVFDSRQLAAGDAIELHFAKGGAHAHIDKVSESQNGLRNSQ
ncbi:MAG: exodeoxyribonuclease VII large subunit [Sterolibacterium sp.]|nr:exodeoxyribonuclease VII large subunit [Sterolibacterium sp.]